MPGLLPMQVVYDGLRSPTEYESTPIIAHVLQEYFLRLTGRYRDFIHPEGTARAAAGTPVPEDQAPAGRPIACQPFNWPSKWSKLCWQGLEDQE